VSYQLLCFVQIHHLLATALVYKPPLNPHEIINKTTRKPNEILIIPDSFFSPLWKILIISPLRWGRRSEGVQGVEGSRGVQGQSVRRQFLSPLGALQKFRLWMWQVIFLDEIIYLWMMVVFYRLRLCQVSPRECTFSSNCQNGGWLRLNPPI
jgi:hypothetical protein